MWDNNLVKTKNLDYTDAAKQLEDGEIDAFFCTSGVQTTVVEELAKHASIRFIDIDSKCAKKLKASYKFYDSFTIQPIHIQAKPKMFQHFVLSQYC